MSSNANAAIVGAPEDNEGVGAAWIYTVSTRQGVKLVGSGAIGVANQGGSVALSSDGNTAIVGGPGDNQFAGGVWVFVVATASPPPLTHCTWAERTYSHGAKFCTGPTAALTCDNGKWVAATYASCNAASPTRRTPAVFCVGGTQALGWAFLAGSWAISLAGCALDDGSHRPTRVRDENAPARTASPTRAPLPSRALMKPLPSPNCEESATQSTANPADPNAELARRIGPSTSSSATEWLRPLLVSGYDNCRSGSARHVTARSVRSRRSNRNNPAKKGRRDPAITAPQGRAHARWGSGGRGTPSRGGARSMAQAS